MIGGSGFFATQIEALGRQLAAEPPGSHRRMELIEKVSKRCISFAASAVSIEDRKRVRTEIFQLFHQLEQDCESLFSLEDHMEIVKRVTKGVEAKYAVLDALYSPVFKTDLCDEVQQEDEGEAWIPDFMISLTTSSIVKK